MGFCGGLIGGDGPGYSGLNLGVAWDGGDRDSVRGVVVYDNMGCVGGCGKEECDEDEE